MHCLGHEFYVEGFESLKQVGPCVCGHAAFWGIAAHHSQWRSYSAMLAGDIDKILREDISNGFAMGVTANQLSQLICKSGSTPIMRSAKRYDDKKGCCVKFVLIWIRAYLSYCSLMMLCMSLWQSVTTNFLLS